MTHMQYGRTALIRAAEEGCTDCIRLLLKSGVDKDFTASKDGTTALISAASWGRTDCVRLLLETGANTNAKDNVRRALIFLFPAIFHQTIYSIWS